MSQSNELSSLIKSEISGPEFTSRFKMQSILGGGAFSSVFRVKHLMNGSIVAVKLLNNRSDNDCSNVEKGCDRKDLLIKFQNIVQKEIEIHTFISSQNHPNIVKLLESFEYNIEGFNSTSKLVHALVLEFCELGNLQQYLKRVRDDIKLSKNGLNRFTFLPEDEVRFALRQLLRALSMIHAHAIVHRDIKPENILLTASSSKPFLDRQRFTLMDCVLKISDFGLAVKMKDYDDWNSGQNCLCGTPITMAPEVFLASKQTHAQTKLGIVEKYQSVIGYGQPADLWSTGVIQYLMLVGQFPFISSKPSTLKSNSSETRNKEKFQHIKRAMKEIVKGTLVVPDDILISASGNDLLRQLLNKDPKQRGFARGILSTHEYFSDNYLPFNYSDDGKPSAEKIKRQKRIKSDCNERESNTSFDGRGDLSSLKVVSVPDLVPMTFQYYKDIDELYTYEYTIFILPNNYGVVIQASKLSILPPIGMEDKAVYIVWCHMVQSGEWYSYHRFEDEGNDVESGCITTDAFVNAPQDNFWQSRELEWNLKYLKDLDYSLSNPMEDFKRCNYCHVSKAVVEELFVLEIIYDTLAALTQDIDASISMEVTLDDGQQRCTASYDCSIQRSTKIVEVLFEDNIKVIYSIHEQEGSVIDHDHFIGKFSENALYETITPNNPLHIFSDYFSFVYSIILKLVELYQYELCLHNTKTKSGIDNRRIQCIREYKCVVKGQSPADWVIESI